MARIAFLAPPFSGHFNPMIVLAKGLKAQGHEVVFVHCADAARLLAKTDLAFEAVGQRLCPPGTLDAVNRRMARAGTLFGLRPMIHDVAMMTGMLCETAPAVFRSHGIDLIVCDQMEAAGGLIARWLDVPFVSVANGLLINREPSIPPPFLPWQADPAQARRNQMAHAISDWLMRPIHQVIAAYADRWHLGALRTAEDCLSPFAQITQAVQSLDFPRCALPSQVHYTGPFRAADEVIDSSDIPFVFASLGTLQGWRASIFHTIAQACHEAGLPLVLAHGGLLSDGEIAGLPGHPTVLAYAPQRALLAKASLCICHGGFNTVMDALSFGVPLTVCPLAFEQPGTAARVQRSGAGEMILPRFLSVRRLRPLIEQVLGNPRYRLAAQVIQREIGTSGGAGQAIKIIQNVMDA